jgi:hypothetical protein
MLFGFEHELPRIAHKLHEQLHGNYMLEIVQPHELSKIIYEKFMVIRVKER